MVHPGDLPVELVRLDHCCCVRGEGRDVLGEVVSQVLVVTEQPGERVPRRVVEPLAADALEHPVLTRANLHQAVGMLQDLVLGGLQHRIHTAQHQQRQHHRAVLVLLEGTAQLVGHPPDERHLVLKTLRSHMIPSSRVEQWHHNVETPDSRAVNRPTEPSHHRARHLTMVVR